jgi:hypothetical protein
MKNDPSEENKRPRPTDRPAPSVPAEDLMPASGLPGDAGASESVDPRLRDQPAEFDPSAHKFDLEPPHTHQAEPEAHPLPEYEHLGELPSSYETGKLYLTARDPYWLFCYWDLSFDQLVDAERRAHDGKVFLQLYLKNGDRVQQIHVSPWAREWMMHTNQPNTTFYCELGYYRFDGGFEVLSRSGDAYAPRDTLSENTRVEFVTIPFRISFSELRTLIEQLQQEGEGLAEVLSRVQAEGYPLPFDHHQGKGLTEAERQQLLDLIGTDFTKRTWIDSQEIVERFTHRFELQANESSGLWPPSSHWLGGSSPSSPFGGGSERDFFMHCNAELILYGGTDPKASLRIDGKDVALDENGNFHFHFNFPDGRHHIPIEATSPDGLEKRSALLSFLRMTATDGDVDASPQPNRPAPFGKID